MNQVSKKKSFVLRLDPDLLAALEKWAADEFRSVNGQIEYLLHQAAKNNKRLIPKNQQSNNETI